MTDHPVHHTQLVSLRRIEGQVRGIQKMIEEKRYCVDILTQLHSVVAALKSVQSNILEKHLQMCVTTSLSGKSQSDKQKKIDEIIELLKTFRKGS